MSEWKKVKLGEILQVKKGEYITKKEAKEGIYPVILGGKEPAYYIDKYNHTGKAIVISRSGASAGYVSFWNEPIFVTDGFLIEPKDDVNFEFLYYILKSKQRELHNTQKGAAIPHVTPALIGSIDGLLPDILTQQGIVSILSRYDSLIENYQKQIKLLEEAAQRLYKEWFVDLHFPGYENTKIVDGVPEGWEKKMIGEIAEINKRNISKNYEYSYVNYTDLGNVRLGRMDTPIKYNYGEEPGRAKRIAIDGDIIWGMVRPNLKSYALVQYPKEQDVFSTGFAVLTAKRVPFSFLYCSVTTDAFVGYLVNCTNGAAYPAVKPEHFSNAELIIPSKNTLDMFNSLVEPMFRRIGGLQSQIRLLTEARDRLLPKLMSGEIEV